MTQDYTSGPTRTARRKFWQQHFQDWQSSGLSQAAYCRQNDLKAHQLYYWKHQCVEPDTGVSFVQLPLSANLPVVATASKVSLYTCNGFRIDIGAGFDPAMLRQLIATVQGL